ncbi:transmembrane protein [Ceratobasidium sp. AG-Ba]|nr:transmembrane protein [Ceratobasidium sp. AG-Ba]QRW15122.1 transmembrane protein [Ceratobasidium sp. AG-Ba]
MMSFTDDPTQAPTVVFPNPGMQALSSVIHLLGVTVLAYCFARRTTFPDLTWSQVWSTVTWPRLCVILVLADSWVFVFLSGVLILGSGLSKDHTSCSLGIFACIALYALSKILTYAFLMEKVHVVWGGAHQPRLKSPVYRICLITMTPYVVIVLLMLLGRIAFIRSDGACVIGLKRLASLSILIYDLYINVFLTAMFIWPLARSKLINPRLKTVATRTLVAACVALTTSTFNMAILTIMHGQQLGWVCLGSCGTDVTVNAIVLFWVTSPTTNAILSHSGPQPTNATTMGGLDPNQPPAFVQGRASPSPGPNANRRSAAVMMSPVPRSPVTPNTPTLNEKKCDAGFLSPAAWKGRFSLSLGKDRSKQVGAEQRGMELSPAPTPSGSPRREVWDERGSSYVTVDDRQLEEGRSAVVIGAPPASRKRASSRTKVMNGVETSGSRNSVLGRLFGTESRDRDRDRDMEVTVTITTQLDHTEEVGSGMSGSRTSLDKVSVRGGGNNSEDTAEKVQHP